MKKLTISVALLLGSVATKAQVNEYIDITKKGIFERSEMVCYNDDTGFSDLEYFYIGRFNSNYHWVKYSNIPSSNNWEIIVSFSDDKGDTRELCTKQGDKPTECKIVDSFATTYELGAKKQTFQVWISKPNVK